MSPTSGSVSYDRASLYGNGTYAFDVVATYSCGTGFSLVGNFSRTCTGDGSSISSNFDGSASNCQRELYAMPLDFMNHPYSLFNSYHLPSLDKSF